MLAEESYREQMKRLVWALGGAVIVVVAAVLLVGAAVGLSRQDEPAQFAATEPTAPGTTPATPTGSPTPTPTPSGPALLLPNMRSLDASDLRIEVVAEVRRLRFSASLANVGAGPLLLDPLRSPECTGNQHGAQQLLHGDRNDDGRFQRGPDRVVERRFAGCMLDHPGHDHWHFDAMAAYTLRRPGEQRPLVSRDKVSFCLRDNERAPGEPSVVPREHFGDCTRNGPQGISPGWVDIYEFDLDGQWLRLPDSVGSETLCLGLEADPLSRLRETDETDNATAIGIEISGTSVRRAPGAACTGSP